MAPNFPVTGIFRIISLNQGGPAMGVSPSSLDREPVYLYKPITSWVAKTDSEDKFYLSVMGFRYTGVYGGKVFATSHSEENVQWVATYYESQDAYTVTQADDTTKGWTVIPNSPARAITIEPIIVIGSAPPPAQLFRFEPSN